MFLKPRPEAGFLSYTRCLPVRMLVRFILWVTRLSLGNLMPVDGFLRLRDIENELENLRMGELENGHNLSEIRHCVNCQEQRPTLPRRETPL